MATVTSTMATRSSPDEPVATSDPVLIQRARARRLAQLGQRVGYLLFLAALVVFFVGLIGNFDAWIKNTVISCVVAGSVVLAPAIVVGYAVRAAERDDLEQGRDIAT